MQNNFELVDSFNFKSHDSSSDSQFLNKLVNPHVSVKPSNRKQKSNKNSRILITIKKIILYYI